MAARLKHKALRAEIVETCRAMNRRGINQGTSGNVSARVPEGFLITPSGVDYDDMSPAMIVPMDLDGGHAGKLKPSSEWRMHLDIYRTRAEAGAVVHTHATHCTALSCLRLGIPAFHYMVAAAGGRDIRCATYATFGTEKLSANMLKALAGRDACLLANHGMICLAGNLARALWLAGEVEALARQFIAARQIGEPNLLSGAEMDRVLTLFKGYGQPQQSSTAMQK
ncbi:MAG: class II aldolase/adducin family protein [Alphaproteobacteria bacterium]